MCFHLSLTQFGVKSLVVGTIYGENIHFWALLTTNIGNNIFLVRAKSFWCQSNIQKYFE